MPILPKAAGFVYVITNSANGKVYVGQTKNVKTRLAQHLSGRAKTGTISKAVRKYGRECFEMCQVGSALTQSDLDNLEAVWIIALRAAQKKFGYNRRLGGNGSSCNKETRELQSAAAKRRGGPWANGVPDHVRQKMIRAWEERKKRTPKSIKVSPPPKPRAAVSEDARRKMSEAQKANPQKYWLGRKRPDMTALNRDKAQGRPKPKIKKREYKRRPGVSPRGSPEEFEKRRNAVSKSSISEQGRERQRKASIARWDKSRKLGVVHRHSEEAKRRRSEAAKKRYEDPVLREKLRAAAIKRWGRQKGDT